MQMRYLRSISSAILALGVVSLLAYFVAKKVEFPVPEEDTRFTVDLVKAPCADTEFLQEQVAKAIDRSKTCVVDNDCVAMFLGCPFGCRTAVNKSSVDEINQLAGLIPSECSTCVYRCMSGDFVEVCDMGVCRSDRLGPNVQPAFPVDA